MAPDLKEELPVLYLRLRDAAQKRRSRIIEFAQKRSGLVAQAWRTIEYQAGNITRGRRDVQAPIPTSPPTRQGQRGRSSPAAPTWPSIRAKSATASSLRCRSRPAPRCCRRCVAATSSARSRWACTPGDGGMHGLEIAKAAAAGKIECLVLLGCDPLADFPDTDLARQMMAGAPRIIAIDTFLTKSSSPADVVLAAAAYGEKSGTTTNIEGRVTTLSEKVTPRGTSRPDWMIAAELAELLGGDLGVSSVDDLTDAIAANVAGFGEATAAALRTARDGIVCKGSLPPATAHDPAHRRAQQLRLSPRRQPQAVRQRDRHGHVAVAGPPGDRAPQLHLHPLDVERVGSTDGADVKVTSKRASMVFKVVADDTVVRGSAWVPFNQPGPSIGELIDSCRRRHRRPRSSRSDAGARPAPRSATSPSATSRSC